MLAYSAKSAFMSARRSIDRLLQLIAIRPHIRQERPEAFLSNCTDQQEADDKHYRAGYAMN